MSNLTRLVEVRLVKCKALKNVDGLSKLPKLTLVNCRGSEALVNIDGIGRLLDTAEVDLTHCKGVILDFRRKFSRVNRFIE